MLKYFIFPMLMISTPALAERVIDTQQYFEGLGTSCSIQADIDRGITTNSITTNIVCGNGKSGNCYAAGDQPHEGYQSCSTSSGRSGGAEGLNNAINWVLNNM